MRFFNQTFFNQSLWSRTPTWTKVHLSRSICCSCSAIWATYKCIKCEYLCERICAGWCVCVAVLHLLPGDCASGEQCWKDAKLLHTQMHTHVQIITQCERVLVSTASHPFVYMYVFHGVCVAHTCLTLWIRAFLLCLGLSVCVRDIPSSCWLAEIALLGLGSAYGSVW